jgi:hypothetical protein
MVTTYCDRITGSSATPIPQIGRPGPQRPDGRYQVLCSYSARWAVRDLNACDQCLPAVARRVDGPVLLALLDESPTADDRANPTDAFYDAIEAAIRARRGDIAGNTYVRRNVDTVDGIGSEIAAALVAAGWTPPGQMSSDQLRSKLRSARADFREIVDEIEAGTHWDAVGIAQRAADDIDKTLGGGA